MRPCNLYCNTLQHTVAHGNTLQHIHRVFPSTFWCALAPYTATHCSTLQRTAAHYSTLQHTAAHCSTYIWSPNSSVEKLMHLPLQQLRTHSILQPQHTATHKVDSCNELANGLLHLTLQHTATHCNTQYVVLQWTWRWAPAPYVPRNFLYCSALQRVAVCCSETLLHFLPRNSWCCNAVVCCSLLQWDTVALPPSKFFVLQCVSVLQSVAVCCSETLSHCLPRNSL